MNRVFEAMDLPHCPSPDPAPRGHPLPQRGEG
jgi:hypothetical protein